MPTSNPTAPQPEPFFNIEEFVNISIIDSEENYQALPAESQWPATWESREVSLEGSCSESFSFNLETTPLEEYVDPFADLLLPSAAEPQESEDFKEKLIFRRQKLDDLAKKLSKKDDQSPHWFLDADCKTPSNPGYWACERTPVQVYRLEVQPVFFDPYADLVKRSSSLYSSAISRSKETVGLTEEEKEICSKLMPLFTSLHLL